MPVDSTVEELIERIIFIHKIEQGLTDAKNNNVVNEGDINSLVEQWLS